MLFGQMIQSKQIGLLIAEVAECFRYNCEIIFSNNLHVQLSESVLVAILNMKWLEVSEIDVLKAISKWIIAKLDREGLVVNRANKQQAFEPFKRLVRFTDLTVNEFIEHKNLLDDLLAENDAYSLLGHLANDTVQLNINYEGERMNRWLSVCCDASLTIRPQSLLPLSAKLRVNDKVSIRSIRTSMPAEVNFSCKVEIAISGECQDTSSLMIEKSVVAGKWEIRFPHFLEMTPVMRCSFTFDFALNESLIHQFFQFDMKNGRGRCSLKSKSKNENRPNIEFKLVATRLQKYHCIERITFLCDTPEHMEAILLVR